MPNPPYTPADGGALDAVQMTGTLNDIYSRLSGVLGWQLADQAGVTSRQLADRYSFWMPSVQLMPWLRDLEDLGSVAGANAETWIVPDNGSAVDLPPPYRIFWPSGKELYLLGVAFWIERAVGGSSSSYPLLKAYKNTELLGGAGKELDTNQQWVVIANSLPFQSKLESLQNNDYIKATIESSVAAPATFPRFGGLSMHPMLLAELNS